MLFTLRVNIIILDSESAEETEEDDGKDGDWQPGSEELVQTEGEEEPGVVRSPETEEHPLNADPDHKQSSSNLEGGIISC